MHEIGISADDLVSALLTLAEDEPVCILDSCGVGHLGSHLLIAGIRPAASIEISNDDPDIVLRELDEKVGRERAAFFTLSYDFGQRLQRVFSRPKENSAKPEPDLFLAAFDTIILHDYRTHRTLLAGKTSDLAKLERSLARPMCRAEEIDAPVRAISNFSRLEYLEAVETIKEYIRRGDTYQTNLTQQMRADLPAGLSPERIFRRLRRDHPAPFAAFIKRANSTVVSASPERFFRIARGKGSAWKPAAADPRSDLKICASPVKGTRPRGKTPEEDSDLRNDLLTSTKDRAENTMIVDLLRNDLGRVCEFGSVEVEALCKLEEHPSLFHLVSTICGTLRKSTQFSEILRAVFPCGSVTGAPKIRTMQIIDELETVNRGLSMGAIGCYLPESVGISDSMFDLNVAIRTMVIRDREAAFNVGGGITIDSDPATEYDESLLKAKALLAALDANFESRF